ncbi:unnamed protein product [Didymodactylos carnosus]|uniref:Condensation domain-containing protein n=1 Tax=Didymodactylos carnosus TaxID=1234261 RepID=A0A814CW69_9BILA|nr:unnamed protein product [Didymodactylos carnosus]CAF1276574.1 unnamed protein product [Didymodactylos carnosus]CAF3721889.1 unnamed protein product [Didymodactylos carnosus]CAF4081625.1 unnamed protein product [Didymodactylos carnosus]
MDLFRVQLTRELTGLEKLLCLHGNWFTIAHVACLTGDQTILISNTDYVIRQLLKRHDRLRSRLQIQRDHTNLINEIPLLETLEYDDKLFSNPEILKLFYRIIYTDDVNEWKQFTEDECNRNVYNEELTMIFPLFHVLFVLRKVEHEQFHMILFSNHCISDGHSGYSILNDFLTLTTSTLKREELVNQIILPHITDLTPKPFGIFFNLISFFAQKFYSYLFKSHLPKIPIKSTFLSQQKDHRYLLFQPIRIKFLFSSSTNEHYEQLKEVCHRRQLTLHGPLYACLLLTIHQCFLLKKRTKQITINDSLEQFDIELDYDMRLRVPQSPLTKHSVGCFIAVATNHIGQVPLHTTFWSFARQCLTITTKVLENYEVYLNLHIMKNIIDDTKTFSKVTTQHCPNGIMAEMSFSNVGKYSFDTSVYKDRLHLRSVHVVNNGSIYHTSTIAFVSCVEQLDFSLAHEMEHEQDAHVFLERYVKLVEQCPLFDENITLYDILCE